MINRDKLELENFSKILIPYSTITDSGLLECIRINEVYIENIGIKKNVLLGFMKENITIDGVDYFFNEDGVLVINPEIPEEPETPDESVIPEE